MVKTSVPRPDMLAFDRVVNDAARSGGELMERLVRATQTALHNRVKSAKDLRERDVLLESAKQLGLHATPFCTQYPKVLLTHFRSAKDARQNVAPLGVELDFDSLELMDENQVHESVALARSQQTALLAADAALADLNTLICTLLGLDTVHPQQNPLRPETYVRALQEVVSQSRATAGMRLDWLQQMSAALGPELRQMYVALTHALRSDGVMPARYAVLQTPSSHSARVGVGATPRGRPEDAVQAGKPLNEPTRGLSAGASDTLLTLDKLRRLLSGELDAPQAPVLSGKVASFAEQFSREFDAAPRANATPAQDFHPTVPAALEALQDMQQVEQVVQRMQKRRSAAASSPMGNTVPTNTAQRGSDSLASREALRRSAASLGQALSLEVVAQMVDNMAGDARLLAPVQQLIRELEPALMRLALGDPRFFSERAHPARQLLAELADRSLAFDAVSAPGFERFFAAAQDAVGALQELGTHDAAPFEAALGELITDWESAGDTTLPPEAIAALQGAEQRHLLAEQIAAEVASHPHIATVPAVVVEFVCGPWSQVIAQARLAGVGLACKAEKYHAVISALLWSTDLGLTRKHLARLTRVIPPLLSTLREGLDTIHYPATKTSAFFEALMNLHQLAFKPASAALPETPPGAEVAAAVPAARALPRADVWVAPQEAKASNFMEFEAAHSGSVGTAGAIGSPAQSNAAGNVASSVVPAPVAPPLPDNVFGAELALGTWVEFMQGGRWARSRLAWVSTHATIYMFTTASGRSSSMTRQTWARLADNGNARVVSDTRLVDQALNAVAQTAMRNSVDGSH